VEMPAVAEVARELVAEAGLGDRVTVRPGNVFTDTFPDCDVGMISHVIEGFEPERARAVIERVHGWLPPGGLLLMHTHVPERATVPFPYLLGLILVVNNTQGGEVYGEDVTRRWVEEIGFHDLRVEAVSPISALFMATR
jgi:cyclopropane fatty-acyl-phospholipid synthase-like methyltransferase